MTTIISLKDSGVVRRCDARCHEAKGTDCSCVCGGENHGVGTEVAIAKTVDRLLAGDLNGLAVASTVPQLPLPAPVRPHLTLVEEERAESEATSDFHVCFTRELTESVVLQVQGRDEDKAVELAWEKFDELNDLKKLNWELDHFCGPPYMSWVEEQKPEERRTEGSTALTHAPTFTEITEDEWREAARELYERDGEVAVDDDARISVGEDPIDGAYVEAWVRVNLGHFEDSESAGEDNPHCDEEKIERLVQYRLEALTFEPC